MGAELAVQATLASADVVNGFVKALLQALQAGVHTKRRAHQATHAVFFCLTASF